MLLLAPFGRSAAKMLKEKMTMYELAVTKKFHLRNGYKDRTSG